jgi:CheY-like chemotaxis protein
MNGDVVIHIVDDEEPVRKSLAFLLTMSDHAVRVPQSATAFMATAKGLQRACLVTDLRMHGMDGMALFDAIHYRDRNTVMSGLALYRVVMANLSQRGNNERVWGYLVSGNYFDVLGVKPVLGRGFLPEEDQTPGSHPVAVLSYGSWERRFGSDPAIVGKTTHFNGKPYTIVGVMPRGYGFPQRNGAWRPLHLERIPEASPSLSYVVGRLAPGHSREEATAQAAAIGARAATMFPETRKNVRLQVLSLPDAVSDLPAAAALVLASINVFLVLLAALLCGNVAMLLFARAVSRERELLVRAALGASRGRLILQFFAEALLLCAVGAVVGLMVAHFVLARAWTEFEVQTGPLPFWIDTSLSSATILYAVGLTLFAAAIAGFVPALKVTSGGAGGRLRAASSGGGGLRTSISKYPFAAGFSRLATRLDGASSESYTHVNSLHT